MSIQEEIKKAIGSHGLWKGRLALAIETGSSEFSPERIRHDNECDFGRWLYGSTIPPAVKHTPEYEACRHLHAEFHQEAANVLKLAVTGHKDKAHEAMHSKGKFAEISSHLTTAMMKWMKVAAD